MKSQPKILDTFQIVGFIISTTISISLIILNQNPISSVTLGLVLASFTQLFHLQLRHSDSERRILQANVLGQALYRDEWLLDHIQQIVDNYQVIKDEGFKFFKLHADDAIVECRNVLHSMAEGYTIAHPRSPVDFGTEACKMAETCLKGTDTGDLSYWRSTHGEKFFQANATAVQHGVKVIRVFIQPIDELRKNVDILEKHQNAGIEVYVVEAKELPSELHEDYFIVDDQIVSVMTFWSNGQPREERISIDKVEVQRSVQKFGLVCQQSKRLINAIHNLKQNE
jgi:hypothetical protein